jgi:hypothetical protein
MTPQELIKELDSCFSQFDNIAERYQLEKLKIIGDSYMCASGLNTKNKGKIKMFFIDRLKKEYSKDEEGHVPNSKLFQIFT